jgi:hypothetical protein
LSGGLKSPLGGMHPGLLSALTIQHIARPQSRAQWEARFSMWARPASDSEEGKIVAAEGRVRRALRRSLFLSNTPWSLVRQGSYHNNTNVRLDSDVDLCICLDQQFFIDAVEGPRRTGLVQSQVPFQDFKAHIAAMLISEFGRGAVQVGRKAIHLNKDAVERVSADIVPAFRCRLYSSLSRLGGHALLAEGIAFETDAGEWLTNFPAQHYQNGCAKNERTGRRFKRVVRILKALRNHMNEDQRTSPWMRSAANGAPSFLIESLVYNCPDNCFGHQHIYDDIVAVLNYLRSALPARNGFLSDLAIPPPWREVNGIKLLFGIGQAWTMANARDFVSSAQAYLKG